MVLKFIYTFAPEMIEMVVLAQLVRASDCGSEGRGFEPHIPPFNKKAPFFGCFFCYKKTQFLILNFEFVRRVGLVGLVRLVGRVRRVGNFEF